MKTKVFRMIVILTTLILFGCFTSCTTDENELRTPEDYTGIWTGEYTGDETGTWVVNIDNSGVVTGNATSDVDTYIITGNIQPDGVISATVGDADSGAVWNGTAINGNVTGVWTNHSYDLIGDFNGRKQ